MVIPQPSDLSRSLCKALLHLESQQLLLIQCCAFNFCLFSSLTCSQVTASSMEIEETRKPGWFVRPQGLASGTSMYSLGASFPSAYVVSVIVNGIDPHAERPDIFSNCCSIKECCKYRANVTKWTEKSLSGIYLWNEDYDMFLNWNTFDRQE